VSFYTAQREFLTKDFGRNTINIVEESLNYFPGLINQKATEELIGTNFLQSEIFIDNILCVIETCKEKSKGERK
jgi:hypothetical protein